MVELLVVIGIIAVLAGLVFVAMGPVRARARLVKCMSNLKNINVAYQMYRQDYDGIDPSPGQYLHCYDVALIPCCILNSELIRYGCARENLYCPNIPHEPPPNLITSYTVCYGSIADLARESLIKSGQNFPLVTFPQVISKRGDRLPLFCCDDHFELWQYPFHVDPVLRLNGQVEIVRFTEDVYPWEL
ncbi:MAG: type II secretion system GspH family protein [Aquificaceae bacterium]|nr:type II secretion system GspH family protein [Aquificaceae bacterium]